MTPENRRRKLRWLAARVSKLSGTVQQTDTPLERVVELPLVVSSRASAIEEEKSRGLIRNLESLAAEAFR